MALGSTFGCVGQQPRWCEDLFWALYGLRFFPRIIFCALMHDSRVNRNGSLCVALTGSLGPLQDRFWFNLQAPLIFPCHWVVFTLCFFFPGLSMHHLRLILNTFNLLFHLDEWRWWSRGDSTGYQEVLGPFCEGAFTNLVSSVYQKTN